MRKRQDNFHGRTGAAVYKSSMADVLKSVGKNYANMNLGLMEFG